MGTKIQLRRGLKADLPTLDNGEVGFAQDTEELFIGSSSGNKKLTFDATKYDSYDAQLADITTQEIRLVDPYNSYQVGFPINTDYIRTRQTVLLAQFYQKIRKKESVVIHCNGDSMTYGLDNVSSDKRTPINGSIDSRASITYPEALQTSLNIVYPNTVTVVNNGFPGDGTQLGYNRTKNLSGANLSLLMYGINDAMNAGISYMGNIEEYIKWYEQIIVRTILKGSAIILLTPTKVLDWGIISVDTFKNALYHLVDKYGIDIVETDEFMQGYNSDIIFSDTIHYKGLGYQLLGNKIASVLVGRGVQNPLYVKDGDGLLTRPALDNCIRNNCEYAYGSDDTPPETGVTGLKTLIHANGNVTYSFYATSDNLIVIPNIIVGAVNEVQISLDFGSHQSDFTFDASVGKSASLTNNPSHTITLTNLNAIINRSFCLSQNSNYIHISRKGWHTLKISSNIGDASLVGIEFMSYNAFKALQSVPTNIKQGHYHVDLYEQWSASPATITQSRISMNTLKDVLGFDYWGSIHSTLFKNKPLKITLFNENQSILEYVVILNKNAYGDKVISLGRRTNIAGTPTERIITDAYVDDSTNEMVIAWGGTTTALGSFNVSIL